MTTDAAIVIDTAFTIDASAALFTTSTDDSAPRAVIFIKSECLVYFVTLMVVDFDIGTFRIKIGGWRVELDPKVAGLVLRKCFGSSAGVGKLLRFLAFIVIRVGCLGCVAALGNLGLVWFGFHPWILSDSLGRYCTAVSSQTQNLIYMVYLAQQKVCQHCCCIRMTPPLEIGFFNLQLIHCASILGLMGIF
jgi:hypothetical protein